VSTQPSGPPAESPAETRTEPLPAAPDPPPPPTRRRTTRFWLIVGAVVLVCLAIVAIGIGLTLSDENGGDGVDPDDHTVSASIDGRSEAQLHLVNGATAVTVRTEAMGDTLYRVSTPPDGDAVPRTVDRGDLIEVHLVQTGEPGPSRVEIVLSTEVRWTVLRFSGGANDQVADLTGGRVAELDFPAGASRIQLTLPVPEGTVPIRMGGGAGAVAVELPPQVPIQVGLHNGAGVVVIDGETHSGVAPGTVFTPDGWEGATDRYDLGSAGVGELTVTRIET
jgi:hypothetical protein